MADNFNDIMDHEDSFATILGAFGISVRGRERFREDFPTASALMSSTATEVKDAITSQNKIFRTHSTANQRCYINATQQNRILAFHRWTVIAVKEGLGRYDVGTVGDFSLDWIKSITEDYLIKDPEVTPQSTAFTIEIPKFDGTNWFDVRSKFHDLLSTRIGCAGLPLVYLIRAQRREWEDTEEILSLQERRIATKAHEGVAFDRDNRELHRILTNVFAGSTLEDIVRSTQATANGIAAWSKITANVQGANYHSDLKRKADRIISGAFFDPNKAFSFEQYFQKHVKAHEIFAAADAPVPEWKKIEDFMKEIRCSHLQNDYRVIKDVPEFSTFTAFYNKMNENYRMLIDQKIIRPVSILKRKISQMDSDRFAGRSGGRGRGRGRGRGHGRGRFQGIRDRVVIMHRVR